MQSSHSFSPPYMMGAGTFGVQKRGDLQSIRIADSEIGYLC